MLTMDFFINSFESYQGISEMVHKYEVDEIISVTARNTKITVEELCRWPMGGYSKGRKIGSYWYVINDLKKNIDFYDWFYEKLTDDESRRVYHCLISYRIIPDINFIKAAYDDNHPQYFDDTFVKCDENEVFVDCGGYIGDTVESYFKVYKSLKKCYCYEPDKENYIKAKNNLSDYPNIVLRNAGVGEKNETVNFGGSDSSASFLGANNDGVSTNIVSLDNDIEEAVTYIKMDVEGFEIPAIIGAKNHIVNDKPKLAICIYHILSDIWEIPKLIDSLNSDYKFYLRHYNKNQNWETVLYAIPPEKQYYHENKLHTVVEMPPLSGQAWHNTDLVKVPGAIPFILQKKYGCDCTLVGTSPEESVYSLSDTVKGLKFKSLKDYSFETRVDYIVEHAQKINILILYGFYPDNQRYAAIYKDINPSGLIYCILDANSWWADRTPFHTEEFQRFLGCVDVFGQGGTTSANYLEKKWNVKIHSITNGFYNFLGVERNIKHFSEKSNTILTVSRLGTDQKATDILLQAFAQISEIIPEWQLKLVGTIEESFMSYIDNFYTEHPELKDRVVFTGPIMDKKELLDEYENAKIFALPSRMEGGSPNVMAEALMSGCVTALTKFDDYVDGIDNGKCGMACDIDDIAGVAGILKKLCNDPDLEKKSERARIVAAEKFDMEKNVDQIYGLLKNKLSERK